MNKKCLCNLPVEKKNLINGQTIFICSKKLTEKCCYIYYDQSNKEKIIPFGLEDYNSEDDSDYNTSDQSDVDEPIGDISSDELSDIQKEANEIIQK